MSAFGALFNNAKLTGSDGSEVAASSLDGKACVGLYFSAHWCPPCRGFTPKLADSYKQLKADGKDFEIVFVSSDKDSMSFKDYFGEMPWMALPFGERDLKQVLSKTYGVSGIPTLVLLDGSGNIITKSGRSVIEEDPRGKKFPWIPPTVQEALGAHFKKGKETISAESLNGKTIGLYFSAHWCGPCRQFTPALAETYKKVVAQGKPFEIIFVSSDQDESAFDEYRSEMPWAALPFENRDGKKALSDRFEVQGIPSLVILESLESGKIINPSARGDVGQDPEGACFPWHPKSLGDLATGADGINENPSLIAFLEGTGGDKDASLAAMQEVADKFYAEARAAGKTYPDMRFFSAATDAGVATRVRQLTKTAGPSLVLLDIPENGAFYAQKIDGALTVQAIDTMLASYKAGSLTRQQLQ